MIRSKAFVGRHILADLHGVPSSALTNPLAIEALLLRAARAAGATPIFNRFHHFGEGQGVTGVVLLQESHISIHTWPEHGFAAVDVFMCGACNPRLAVDIIAEVLAPASVSISDELRGPVAPSLQPAA